MANQDFALQDNDLYVVNGDLSITESDNQHIADSINAFKGWWKEYPADGVGIFQYLKSIGQEQRLRREIIISLQSDGYYTVNPKVTTDTAGNLYVDPNSL